MSICKGPDGVGLRAGAAAAAAPPELCAAGIACEVVAATGVAGAAGSGSRMSAPSPRPNAFLGIANNLLGELRVSLSSLAVYIIENNRFTKTRRFGKANVARYQALKDLRAEETPQVRSHLP